MTKILLFSGTQTKILRTRGGKNHPNAETHSTTNGSSTQMHGPKYGCNCTHVNVNNQTTNEKEQSDQKMENFNEQRVKAKLLKSRRSLSTKFIHSREYSNLDLESRMIHSNFYNINGLSKDDFASEILV